MLMKLDGKLTFLFFGPSTDLQFRAVVHSKLTESVESMVC